MGRGRREALGVRQLAAALLLCTNNVPVPISASGCQRTAGPVKPLPFDSLRLDACRLRPNGDTLPAER
ncbi:MAG: hypothetical protein GX456_04200 [Verrucomicrobia bacterium]|nr:hypothetical protein [Verrucomicrobiota bacterium]